MFQKKEKSKTEAVSFRIDAQLLETLKAEFIKADVSVSDGIRQILQQWLVQLRLVQRPLAEAVSSEDVMDYKRALQNIILNDYANSGGALSALLATVFHGVKGVKNMEVEELEQEVYEMYSDDLEMDGVDTSDLEKMKEWTIKRAKSVPDRATEF